MSTPRTPRHARGLTGRGKVLTSARVVLAAGLLVGLGAAASSAAWTNGAYFRSGASSASVELQACSSANPGATNPSWTCENADTSGAAHVVLSSSAFSLMVPGQTYSTTVQLRNAGTVPLTVSSTIAGIAEPLTGTAPNATLTVSPAGPTTIAAAGSLNLTVTVTTPSNWDMSHAAKTSAAALEIVSTGTTTP